MDIEFSRHGSWKDFYEDCGVHFNGDPNDSGWVQISPCIIHYENNHNSSAGINIYSGNYRCFSGNCQEHYREQLGYNTGSEILTPREFLMVSEHLAKDAAIEAVNAFKQTLDPDTLDNTQYSKSYRPQLTWTDYIAQAEKQLSPDLHIVQEYCESKGLDYDTLKLFHCGYTPETNKQDEYIVIPYFFRGIVGSAKARTIDGRKSAPKGAYPLLFNIDTAISSGSSTVIVVEGETDCMILTQELRKQGILIPVVATPGNHVKKEFKTQLHPFQHIICIPQIDEAGEGLVKGLSKIAKNKLVLVRMEDVWSPYAVGNDISDFFRQHDASILIDKIPVTLDSEKRVLTGDEWMEMGNVEIPYLINGIIERGTKTLIVGEPKTKKTWIVLQMMDTVVNCTPFLGFSDWIPNQGGLKAMLVEEEGSKHRMGSRLAKITQGEGGDNMRILHRQGIKVDDSESFARLQKDIEEFKPDLLIFDPYASLHSQDENSATGTGIITDALNRLLQRFTNMAIVIVHHSSKGNPKSARGSSALWGQVDQQITLTNDGKSSRVQIFGRDLDTESRSDMLLTFNSATGRHSPVKLETTKQKEEEMARSKQIREEVKGLLIKHLTKNGQTKLSTIYSIYVPHVTTKDTIRLALQELVDSKEIVCEGVGLKGSPKLYKMA